MESFVDDFNQKYQNRFMRLNPSSRADIFRIVELSCPSKQYRRYGGTQQEEACTQRYLRVIVDQYTAKGRLKSRGKEIPFYWLFYNGFMLNSTELPESLRHAQSSPSRKKRSLDIGEDLSNDPGPYIPETLGQGRKIPISRLPKSIQKELCYGDTRTSANLASAQRFAPRRKTMASRV